MPESFQFIYKYFICITIIGLLCLIRLPSLSDYQSHILRGVLALKHVSAALHFAILIAERRIDRNSIFQPRSSDLEPKLDNTHDIVKYIEQHGEKN